MRGDATSRARLYTGAIGAWRSLVARSLWEREVAGSNPAAPTVRLVAARGLRGSAVAAIAPGAAFAARTALLADRRKAQTFSALVARPSLGDGPAVVRVLLGGSPGAEQGPKATAKVHARDIRS